MKKTIETLEDEMKKLQIQLQESKIMALSYLDQDRLESAHVALSDALRLKTRIELLSYRIRSRKNNVE